MFYICFVNNTLGASVTKPTNENEWQPIQAITKKAVRQPLTTQNSAYRSKKSYFLTYTPYFRLEYCF